MLGIQRFIINFSLKETNKPSFDVYLAIIKKPQIAHLLWAVLQCKTVRFSLFFSMLSVENFNIHMVFIRPACFSNKLLILLKHFHPRNLTMTTKRFWCEHCLSRDRRRLSFWNIFIRLETQTSHWYALEEISLLQVHQNFTSLSSIMNDWT